MGAKTLHKNSVSIIAPLYNEEGNVKPLIDAVEAALANYDLPWELLIVDDGSTDSTLDIMDYKERAAEAVKLYEKAGYGKDKPLEVELRYNTSDNHKRIALAVAGTWQRVFPGLKVNLVNEEWKVYLESRKAKQVTQIFRAGWIGDYNDANTFLELWQSKSGLNDTGYDSTTFDQALKDAGQEADADKRKALLQKAERDLLDSHSVIPIYTYVTTHLINPKVKGLSGNVMDHTRDKYVTIEE